MVKNERFVGLRRERRHFTVAHHQVNRYHAWNVLSLHTTSLTNLMIYLNYLFSLRQFYIRFKHFFIQNTRVIHALTKKFCMPVSVLFVKTKIFKLLSKLAWLLISSKRTVLSLRPYIITKTALNICFQTY